MASALTIGLYDPAAPTVLVDALTGATDRQVTEKINAGTTGSITLGNDHSAYTSVTRGMLVRFFVDATAVGQMVIEQRGKTSVSPDGDSGLVTEFSGRGVEALLERSPVYPEGGVNNIASDVTEGFDTRFFHWGSYLYLESASVGGSWSSAVQLFRQDQAPPLAPPSGFSGAPEGWPPQLLGAYWIWSQAIVGSSVPTGTSHFRKEFNIASSGLYALFYAGNDQFDIFLDGIKLDGYTEQGPGGWKQTRVRYLVISSGNHLVAMSGTNLSVAGASSAIAGVIFGVVPVNDDGSLGSAVTFTDNTWSADDYGAETLGMTPGRIIRFLVEEGQARGDLPAGLTLNFTDTLDSNGNAWTAYEFTCKVGVSLLDVLEQMSESMIDWRMSPDALELNAVNKGGWAGSSGKTLTTTQLMSLVHTENFKPRNALLVRHLDGYREVTDSGLIASYGRGGAYLELGSTNSAAEIDRVAGANIDELGQPMVTTELSWDDTTATYRPWLDMDLFETVTVPGLDAATDTPAVNTLTVADGSDGAPVFSMELGVVKEDPETRFARALRRVMGSLNGRSMSTAPARSFRPTLVPPAVETQSWGGSGTPSTTTISPPWFPHYTHQRLRVTIGRDAGTTAMTVTVYKNGVSVGTVSTSATGTAAFGYITTAVTGGTDYLQVKVTTAGTGSTNPSAVIEAV